MFCPNCTTQNHATDVRCMHCGTTLIFEAQGHSTNYRRGALFLNLRMYGGIGSVLGLAISFLLLNTVLQSFYFDSQEKGIVTFLGATVGAIGGWIVALIKRQYS